MMAEDKPKCVICNEGEKNNPLAKNPTQDIIQDIKDFAVKRLNLGEIHLKPLADYLSNLNDDELSLVRYHSTCRKKVVNRQLADRAVKRSMSSPGVIVPPKVGRPSTSGQSDQVRPGRAVGVKPKEKMCVFSPCSCIGKEDLHMVKTNNRGQTLLDIKHRTASDHTRTCLSSLHEPGDAAAQEKWYHSSCLKEAIRSLPEVTEPQRDCSIRQYISDTQLIMYVESCISESGSVLSMNEINEVYVKILHGNKIEKSDNQKKYLKALLKKHINEIVFVQPPRRNESEYIMVSKAVGDAVDLATSQFDSEVIDTIVRLSRTLRNELLQYKNKWKFTGRIDDFENPPLLQFLLEQVLFGPYTKYMTGQRSEHCHKSVDVLTQLLIQNLKTDRQVRHNPNKDTGFQQTTETPVSIGLPLSLHMKVRDKRLVNFLSDMYMGSSYKNVLNIQKRVENAVAGQMELTGGYVIPRFVKKNKSIYFAIDNIDFMEDTPYGQNTLHGSLVVINQEDDDSKEPVREGLTIPDQPTPVSIEMKYLDEPTIFSKSFRIASYEMGDRRDLMSIYRLNTHTWALASYLSNEAGNSTLNNPEDANIDGLIAVTHQEAIPDQMSLEQHPRSRKEKKRNVMPTWGATNSLLCKAEGIKIKKTNSEVVAPLFKQSPTDYATLYTVLMLTQDISAVVVGKERKTVITLDLDLYARALKIQQSTGNRNWVLRAGELHICMAALHALAKYVEGSGLDSAAIELSIYSPAALRAIFTGKAFKRGVEYHIMNALACLYLRFDYLFGNSPPSELRQQCVNLRQSLYTSDGRCAEIFKAVKNTYSQLTENATAISGELALFLTSYITQVDALLGLIRACRQNDWEGFLAAVDDQIKYFMAHDLLNYARLMPVHLAQMRALQLEDPETWNALKCGDFSVRKSDTPFTSLFVDQALEQEIKKLKGIGGIVGLTQKEEILDRFLLTHPELTRIASEFQQRYSCNRDTNSSREIHYQLVGNMAVRLATNSRKLKEAIEKHCEGNPYVVGTSLKNIMSSMMVPEEAKQDIINRDEKGQAAYKKFVDERLTGSTHTIWDTMNKLKLKTHSTWMAKQKVRVGEKVVKLREERLLLARFLVIQQSRPELVPKLPITMGDYEMSVVPRSMFANDGSLLIPTDKSSILHLVEAQSLMPHILQDPDDDASYGENVIVDNSNETEETSKIVKRPESVMILDAMAVLQSMKKTPGMTKILHLKVAFVNRIDRLLKGYCQGRVIFDRYLDVSLKNKTRAKRSSKSSSMAHVYDVHDEMSIAKFSLRELLSSSRTKSHLTELLAKAILETSRDTELEIVVSYQTKVESNKSSLLPDNMKTHNHEEADTMIPLHVLDVVRDGRFKNIDVWSPDSDVLVLLMDLAAGSHLGEETGLRMLTGRASKFRAIDVCERVNATGKEKARGLIGFHHFTGADWGGKFVGISKKTWTSAYLSLDPNDDIVQTFQNLGRREYTAKSVGEQWKDNGEIPEVFRPLEKFVCQVYSNKTALETIPALRWELFRTKNLEGEKLPPTRGTLLLHIVRCNYMSMRDKIYTSPNPELPPIEEYGWEGSANDRFVPVMCLNKPAPQAVLELVKCGCSNSCKSALCSCAKNNLACTALCKCTYTDCSNAERANVTESDDEDESDF